MFELRILQARYGDCLILDYGAEDEPHHVLIDGGPKRTYEAHLQPVLREIGQGQAVLDLVVLSHIDEDHVSGLLDLFEDLVWQRAGKKDEIVHIEELWHNSFSEVLGEGIPERLGRVLDRAGPARSFLSSTARVSRSIAQGDELTRHSERLRVDRNQRFAPGGIVTLDQAQEPVALDGLTLHILGPTAERLAALREEWLAWLQEQEDRLSGEVAMTPRAARSLDTSIPNLSSILLLAEADDRRVLLTGDGRSDDIEEGLQRAGYLEPGGTLHVDVLKLPHHGSKRNVTADFLRRVTADVYVVSASGYHGHPSLDTLRWIVTAAHEQGRPIEIVATNSTSAIRKLVEAYGPEDYGYHLTVMPPDTHHYRLSIDAVSPE